MLVFKKRCSLPKLSFRFQCTATDGCDASSASPFCGTSASNNGGANDVDVGVCGKCQLTAGGGGIVSRCTQSVGTDCDLTTTSCLSTAPVCCKDGKCVASDGNSANGESSCGT